VGLDRLLLITKIPLASGSGGWTGGAAPDKGESLRIARDAKGIPEAVMKPRHLLIVALLLLMFTVAAEGEVMYTVSFDDPGGMFAPFYPLITDSFVSAGQEWSRFLVGTGTIDTVISFNPSIPICGMRLCRNLTDRKRGVRWGGDSASVSRDEVRALDSTHHAVLSFGPFRGHFTEGKDGWLPNLAAELLPVSGRPE
jgi:hypothetical protein